MKASNMSNEDRSQEVIAFWFDETPPEKRFAKDPVLDQTITTRFRSVYDNIVIRPATQFEDPSACFAAILVLDQFARNMFRGDRRSWEADPLALTLAQKMIDTGWIDDLPDEQRNFVLLPFMHSEDLAVHDRAAPYFERYADGPTRNAEQNHRTIIEQFGRYPHRNAVLGRNSTDAERAFLQDNPGF